MTSLLQRKKDRTDGRREGRHRKKQERWKPQERSLEMDNDDGERGREVMIGVHPELHG